MKRKMQRKRSLLKTTTQCGNFNMYNFVDVSGVGNSGKTAVSDILREFDQVWVPDDSFEFDFFRLPNGILDLYHHLAEDWSPIRSHHALKCFLELTKNVALSPKKYNVLQKLSSTGNRYDLVFNKQFSFEMLNFANQLNAGTYQAEWPYELTSACTLKKIIQKIAIKFELKSLSRTDVYLTDSSQFRQKLTLAMNKIYDQVVNKTSCSHVVLHNCFEPFNPVRSLDILENSKSIIVYRDPRDVYVAGLKNNTISKKDITFGSNDEHGLSESFLATYDINLFILRYQTYMNNIYRGNDPRVLKIRFEDLVINYEKSVKELSAFLKIDPQLHVRKKTRFQPEKSIANIGKWKQFRNTSEIKLITEKLSDFIWNN